MVITSAGDELARDQGVAVCLQKRGDAIASKLDSYRGPERSSHSICLQKRGDAIAPLQRI